MIEGCRCVGVKSTRASLSTRSSQGGSPAGKVPPPTESGGARPRYAVPGRQRDSPEDEIWPHPLILGRDGEPITEAASCGDAGRSGPQGRAGGTLPVSHHEGRTLASM